MARKLLAAILVLALGAWLPARAQTVSDPAAQTIQTFYDSLLDVMKRGPQLGAQGRFRALAPAVDRAYDLPGMMGLIVGPSWSTMSAQDRDALVAAFRRLTIANYASNFDSYSGERFVVDPNVQTRATGKLVTSQLIPSDGKPVDLYYRMDNVGGSWRIMDVYLAGYVDQAALKRSDYAATLSSQGPQALAAKINSVADNTLTGK